MNNKITRIERPKITFYGSKFGSVCFPSRTPRGDFWERTNGRDSLILFAGEKKGKEGRIERLKLPAGIIPRRILVYLSHAWMETKQKNIESREINLGGSINQFLNNLKITQSGNSYKKVQEQVERLFLAKIAIISNSEYGYRQDQMLLADRYECWWDKKNNNQLGILPSYVKISSNLAEILDKSIPLSKATISGLGSSCLAFDLYVWLNLRHYTVTNPILVSWPKIHQQLGANYSSGSKRQFKIEFKRAFELVNYFYKHNSKLASDGIKLIYSQTDVEPQKESISKIIHIKDFLE